jgi:hypothetical protein
MGRIFYNTVAASDDRMGYDYWIGKELEGTAMSYSRDSPGEASGCLVSQAPPTYEPYASLPSDTWIWPPCVFRTQILVTLL